MRLARGDLGSVSDARARELLREFARPVEAAARDFEVWGRHVGLERADLRQLAQIAVLDASLTHRPERSSLSTWVRKVIRWRLTETLEGAERPEEPLEAPQRVLNGENPEELVERLRVVRWVRGQIDRLDVRQRTILACRLDDESFKEIAATLGIGRTRMWQEAQEAFAVLRAQAEHDRLDVTDLDS